jgi:hypothetical protein
MQVLLVAPKGSQNDYKHAHKNDSALCSNFLKEVIAPLVQNLVNDVQFHTKRFKSWYRHTKPCQ